MPPKDNNKNRRKQSASRSKEETSNAPSSPPSLYNSFISTVTYQFKNLSLGSREKQSDLYEKSTIEPAPNLPDDPPYRRVTIHQERDVHQFVCHARMAQFDKISSRTVGNPWRRHGVMVKLTEIGGVAIPKASDRTRLHHKSNIAIEKGSLPPRPPNAPAIILGHDPNLLKIKIPSLPTGVPANDAAHRVAAAIQDIVLTKGLTIPLASPSSGNSTISLPHNGFESMGEQRSTSKMSSIMRTPSGEAVSRHRPVNNTKASIGRSLPPQTARESSSHSTSNSYSDEDHHSENEQRTRNRSRNRGKLRAL